MPIFEKIKRVLRSNINDLLDHVEDPERILDQLLEDMRHELKEAKVQIAAAIWDGNKLEAQHKENLESAEKWEKRAIVFIQNGDDARAREALRRKRSFSELADGYHKQFEVQKESISALKSGLATLEDKIEEAEQKRNLLISRKKRAEAEKAIHQTVAKLSDADATNAFERIQDKISDSEAEAEAMSEIQNLSAESSLFKPDPTDEIDDELAKLKAKLKQ